LHRSLISKFSLKIAENFVVFFAIFFQFAKICRIFAKFRPNFGQIFSGSFQNAAFFENCWKRYGEVRKFKKVRKFASSNLKFRSSKFKFTEILICNPGKRRRRRKENCRRSAVAQLPSSHVASQFSLVEGSERYGYVSSWRCGGCVAVRLPSSTRVCKDPKHLCRSFSKHVCRSFFHWLRS